MNGTQISHLHRACTISSARACSPPAATDNFDEANEGATAMSLYLRWSTAQAVMTGSDPEYECKYPVNQGDRRLPYRDAPNSRSESESQRLGERVETEFPAQTMCATPDRLARGQR